MSEPSIELPDCPPCTAEFVRRALDAVRTAVGVSLEFDSDTLPLLDHYIKRLPKGHADAAALIAAMTGSYFGEAVRQTLGGAWKVEDEDPASWRIVLPGGLSFSPVRLALSAILLDEEGEGNGDFQAPPKLMAALTEAMERMGSVGAADYFTLSCRFDTLEHLQEVILAVADSLQKKRDLESN
ncbi:MAG: hypothetical protein GY811_16320 [Myxococcales bacterium]|nr:hypothetical protein [Myxococcales bacterium]